MDLSLFDEAYFEALPMQPLESVDDEVDGESDGDAEDETVEVQIREGDAQKAKRTRVGPTI